MLLVSIQPSSITIGTPQPALVVPGIATRADLSIETAPTPPSSTACGSLLRVWLGLLIAVALDVPVQLMWKALMLKYGDPARGPHLLDAFHQFRWFSHQTRTWALLGLFLCQFLNWMWVLGNADLSYAQPFTALSYVAVSACAAIFFHEHLSPLRILGITLILLGVVLVGATQHRTTRLPTTPTGGVP